MNTQSASFFEVSKIKFEYLQDLFSLTKPRLSSLVIFTSALGMFLTTKEVPLSKALLSILFTSGLVGGACVINCLMEKDIDALMERTKNRPLPSGRVSSEVALIVGLLLISFCLLGLYLFINPLTAFLGFLAAIVYIALYTPLKRKTSWALFAGAIPGAIPPLMGWTTATNSIDPMGLIVFSLLFVWQLPHFLSISIYHSDDYNNADIKTFPANIGFKKTLHHIVIYTFLLLLVSLFPYFLSKVSWEYFIGAFLVGALFLVYSFIGFFKNIHSVDFKIWARKYFLGSLMYLPVVFILMLYFKNSFNL